MAHQCELVDGVFLSEIARAICAEIPQRNGESAAGRRRLLDCLNQKIAALALPLVAPDDRLAVGKDASTLMVEAIANDELCAHTRNFLQTALSRLERFDEEHHLAAAKP